METIVIQVRCRTNGKLFRVTFALDAAQRYRVESARGGSAVSAALPDAPQLESGRTKAAPAANHMRAMDGHDIPAWSLDWSGAACPHCSKNEAERLSIVQCGACGGLMCGDGGRNTFPCRHCDSRLRVNDDGGGIMSVKAQPAPAARKDALALPSAGGLLGPARRLLKRGKKPADG